MRRLDRLRAATLVLLIALASSARAEEGTMDDVGAGGGIVSPTVMATWLEHDGGPVAILDLLVLWRGTPGWFLSSGGTSSSAEGASASMTIEMPGDDLRVVFDATTRIARVQGERISHRRRRHSGRPARRSHGGRRPSRSRASAARRRRAVVPAARNAARRRPAPRAGDRGVRPV
jgi:hypothetical protein